MIIFKTSSLFLLCLGLDNATRVRVCPGDRGVGGNHQMAEGRWSLWSSFSDISDYGTETFNALTKTGVEVGVSLFGGWMSYGDNYGLSKPIKLFL